ncbi:MAG TPA: hypothetical protein VGF76_05960, partial [Polyangiaceae bacterium]
MTYARAAFTSLSLITLSVVLWGSGCSSDDAPDGVTPSAGNAGAAGHSAGAGSGGKAGSHAGSGGATTGVGGADELGGTDQGGADMGGAAPIGAGGMMMMEAAGAAGESSLNMVVNATIPAGGGNVPVALPSGQVVTFVFPASAAGKSVTLTPTDSTAIGWPAGQFSDVIKMEPNGTTFADPVVIKLASKDLLVLDFSSSGARGPGEGLALNAAGDGLLLKHFSTLAVVPTGKSCDSASGWNGTPNSASCESAGAATTSMDFGCKGYNFCEIIMAHCCVVPGATTCQEGDANVTVTYTESDGNGSHPYCQPSLTSVTPNSGAVGTSALATGPDWDAYYAKDNAVHYVSGIRFFNQAGVAVNPQPLAFELTQHTDNRNLVTFTVPNIPAGLYNFAVVFRNGF